MTDPTAVKPTKKLRLPDGELTPAMLGAFRSVLAYAEAQTRRPPAEAETAVHEFRKSVRRARSVVKFLRRFLRKGAYRSLNASLRDAVARTSVLRDVDVLVGHVAALPDDPQLAPVRAALNAHLEKRQQELRAEQTGDALADGLRRLRPLPAQLKDELEQLGDEQLRAALEGSFKKAAKTLAKAQAAPSGEHEALHDFRKRVKELRYQLELLRPRAPVEGPLDTLAGLAESLGEITDLAVLWDYTRAHEAELETDTGPLNALLAEQTRIKLETVLGGAAPFFAREPAAFAAELISGGSSSVPASPE